MLGSTEVFRNGLPVAIPGGRQRALLAVLALGHGRPVSVEEIIERLWGERFPNGAATTVRSYVKRLRRMLDTGESASVIRTEAGGYRLDIGYRDFDWHRFRELTAQAAACKDPETELSFLRRALALWRGPVLYDIASESLHREVAPALSEARRQALHRRIELDMDRGGAGEVIAELRLLVGAEPLQERFWAQLMTALTRSGRTAEAMASYEECRQELAFRLGVDPGAELRALHQAMLTGRTAPAESVPPAA